MEQGKSYKSKCAPHAHLETRDSTDAYGKQKKSQSFTLNGSNRTSEPVAGYYVSTSYKPQKNHPCSNPTHSKFSTVHDHVHLQSSSKLGADKHCAPGFPLTRKTRYDNELGNAEKMKIILKELLNSPEDNADEIAEAEVTEDDREEACEFLNKDFEDQEADDEIDNESDVPPQSHRVQRGNRNQTMNRPQRCRLVDQQDSRRQCCQQYISSMQNHSTSPKYYRTVAEHEVPDPNSDEDFVRTSCKSPTRRQLPDYRQWSLSRNGADRYDEFPGMTPPTRRARTKPEFDQLVEAELYRSRRCNRCGNMSGKRNELLARNGCRFDDRVNIITQGPIGDDVEFRGRSNPRHIPKETAVPFDVSPCQCSTKTRRSRDAKATTIYETPEQLQMEKLVNDYTRASSRYPRKSADVYTEKSKRSLHTCHGAARISSRLVE